MISAASSVDTLYFISTWLKTYICQELPSKYEVEIVISKKKKWQAFY